MKPRAGCDALRDVWAQALEILQNNSDILEKVGNHFLDVGTLDKAALRELAHDLRKDVRSKAKVAIDE